MSAPTNTRPTGGDGTPGQARTGERDGAPRPLRRGWTTGACATAATKAAFTALHTDTFPDPVAITLPRGERPAFVLAHEATGPGWARAAVVKDAGDDPDVTHGACVVAEVRHCHDGVRFLAGEGVGTVTREGLPVNVGEPAINPVPRAMMIAAIGEVAVQLGVPATAEITLSIPGGEALAARTWNPRLGIVGGLSILGTTGVVVPYSCAAWIHSIHRGIDVARAAGLTHVAAATGSTSEKTAQVVLNLPDHAMIDMGDFAGGVLKYVRNHPVAELTIAGGFAKLTKLAAGALDLHSSRSQVDFACLSRWARACDATPEIAAAIADAPTALAALTLAGGAGLDLPAMVAGEAANVARGVLRGAPVVVHVMVVGRDGAVLAQADGAR